MVEQRYLSDDPGIIKFHVIEECVELIEQVSHISIRSCNLVKQICKAERFGLDSIVPNEVTTLNITNREMLISELQDVITVAQRMLLVLNKEKSA